MTIELDADVFDSVQLSALVFGGIGAGTAFEHCYFVGPEARDDSPVCVHGHWAFVRAGVWDGKHSLPITARESDAIVRAINKRKNRDSNSRVSWEEYTKELGIVRKESK